LRGVRKAVVERKRKERRNPQKGMGERKKKGRLIVDDKLWLCYFSPGSKTRAKKTENITKKKKTVKKTIKIPEKKKRQRVETKKNVDVTRAKVLKGA